MHLNTLHDLYISSVMSHLKIHYSASANVSRLTIVGYFNDRLTSVTFFLFIFNCLGVYLPLLWEQSFCWKSPIALGYTRGHFSALVAMENDGYDNRGAGANLNTDDDVTVTFLPLVDSERKLLHVHFLSAQEVRHTHTHTHLYITWTQHTTHC